MCIVYLLYSLRYVKLFLKEQLTITLVKVDMHSKTDVLFFDVLLIFNICISLK